MLKSVLTAIRQQGATLTIEDGQLHLKGDGAKPSPELVRTIRENRVELMLALGAPRREAVLSEVRKLRPYLTETLQALDDDSLATLVDWHLRVGRERLGGGV